MEEISVTDDGMPPGKDWPWTSFLANRRNKTDLVAYLSKKLINSNCLLDLKEIFYVSFEVQLHQVTHKYTQQYPFSNNHEEADIRIFWLCSLMQGDIIIRSTDTDLLANALINHTQLKLGGRNIVIHFRKTGQEFVYCWINQLVKLISSSSTYSLLTARNNDVSRIIVVLHFITGCDLLSFLRGFTKGYCFKTLNKHSDIICPESADILKKQSKVNSQN